MAEALNVVSSKCMACGACKSICPKGCIELALNDKGEMQSIIDTMKCINCGLCRKICSFQKEKNIPKACFVAARKNREQRLKCASGGIVSLSSELFISEMGGVVFGVAFQGENNASYCIAETVEEIEKLKGSMYVQANTDVLFEKLEAFLQSSKVLVVGIPCVINAVYSFCTIKNIHTKNLFTIDLFCHGTCPSAFLKPELKRIAKGRKINEISFRSNMPTRRDYVFYAEGEDFCYQKPSQLYPYYWGFLRGVTLNNTCYTCGYANIKRVGDISVGDCISSPNMQTMDKEFIKASTILVNTKKGGILFEQTKKDSIVASYDVEKEIAYNEGLKKHSTPSFSRKMFQVLHGYYGYYVGSRMVAAFPIMVNYLLRLINYFLKRIGCKTIKYL